LVPDLKRVIPGREPLPWPNPPAILQEWAYGPAPVGDLDLLTTEHAHELLWSVFTGEPFTRVLNVLNTKGFVHDLPPNACVETVVTVAGMSVSAEPIVLPTAILSLVQRWTAIHELSIRAGRDCDYEAALQALALDPHVREADSIPELLDDLIAAMKPWLPGTWTRRR
jgi:6-phospho-beta-glucosidase